MKTVVVGLGPFVMGGDPGTLANWRVNPSLCSTISSANMDSGIFCPPCSVNVTDWPLLNV